MSQRKDVFPQGKRILIYPDFQKRIILPSGVQPFYATAHSLED